MVLKASPARPPAPLVAVFPAAQTITLVTPVLLVLVAQPQQQRPQQRKQDRQEQAAVVLLELVARPGRLAQARVRHQAAQRGRRKGPNLVLLLAAVQKRPVAALTAAMLAAALN